MSNDWLSVNKVEPCEICHRPDWCSRSIDGFTAICRREDNGSGTEKIDSTGTPYFVYRRASRLFVPDLTEQRCLASSDMKHQIYTALLEEFSLSDEHRTNLIETRGIPADDVVRHGYGTLPSEDREFSVSFLEDEFGQELLLTVPGFCLFDDDGKTKATLAGLSGLMIPTRDVDGRIHAIRIRADDDGKKSRYTWLSSKKYGGLSPGAQVHVSLFEGDTETIRITEGELKADIATILSGMLTISIPGATIWRPVLPVVKALVPKCIHLAFDADKTKNQHVARAQRELFWELKELGYKVEIESWNH